jgi:hypothetical protein
MPPFAGIGRMVTDCSLSLREEENDLVVKINLATKSEDQATQLQQLAQGAVAMMGLFKEEIRRELKGDDVASRVIPVLDQIQVSRDESDVTIVTKIPESLIIEFLRKEADLPL